MITLINKGANINIYNVIDENGKNLPSIDIELGELETLGFIPCEDLGNMISKRYGSC